MCYSASASAIAWTIGMLSGIFACVIGHTTIGILILTYTQVQLGEGLIWTSLDPPSQQLNQLGTNIVAASLSIHALVLIVALYLTQSTNNWTNVQHVCMFVLLVLSLVIAICMNMMKRPYHTTYPQPTCKDVNTYQCRLLWNWSDNHYYYYLYTLQIICIFLALPLACYPQCWWILSFFIVPYVFLRILTKQYRIAIFSTLWCFFSAIGAPLLVLGLWCLQ